MVGFGARLYLALGAIGLLAAGAYGVASDGDPLGVLSVGYKSAVGEHFGYSVLLAAGAASLVVGVILLVLRDADPVPVAAGAVDAVPEVAPPTSATPWSILGAFGVIMTLLGLVADQVFFVVGLVVIAITIIEWSVSAWADRATGDPEVNRSIRNRLMAPIEIPVGALLVIGFLVVGVSRVLLAVSSTAAWVLGSVWAVLIVTGAFLVATRRERSRGLVVGLLLVLALAVLAGGIAGVALGEREHDEEAPAAEEGG